MDRSLKASYFLALLAEAIVRFPHARQRRRTTTSHRQGGASERVVLGALGLAAGVLPVVYSISHLLDFADYRLPRRPKILAGSLGIAFLSAAVWVFWRAHHDLGANWSPTLEINTQQTLV